MMMKARIPPFPPWIVALWFFSIAATGAALSADSVPSAPSVKNLGVPYPAPQAGHSAAAANDVNPMLDSKAAAPSPVSKKRVRAPIQAHGGSVPGGSVGVLNGSVGHF